MLHSDLSSPQLKFFKLSLWENLKAMKTFRAETVASCMPPTFLHNTGKVVRRMKIFFGEIATLKRINIILNIK